MVQLPSVSYSDPKWVKCSSWGFRKSHCSTRSDVTCIFYQLREKTQTFVFCSLNQSALQTFPSLMYLCFVIFPQESLDEVTIKDTLEGDNMYTCSQCGKKVRAEKRSERFKILKKIMPLSQHSVSPCLTVSLYTGPALRNCLASWASTQWDTPLTWWPWWRRRSTPTSPSPCASTWHLTLRISSWAKGSAKRVSFCSPSRTFIVYWWL